MTERGLADLNLMTKVQRKGLTRPLVGPVTVNELSKAENNVIGYVQRTCFSADLALVSEGKRLPGTSSLHRLNPIVTDGLLRVGGRLDSAPLPYDLKHPIILPECHLNNFRNMRIKMFSKLPSCFPKTKCRNTRRRFGAKQVYRHAINSRLIVDITIWPPIKSQCILVRW